MTRRAEAASSREQRPLPAMLRLCLLGPLAIDRNQTEVELTGVKRRGLLIFLALNLGEAVSQERIVEALWPGRPTGREEATLQVHISHLRDRLERDRDTPPRVLVTTGQGYMLDRHEVESDIDRFDFLVGEARRLAEDDPQAALDELDEALELWRGRPLQDVEYEEFAQGEIRRLQSARVDAVLLRATALIELDRDPEAVSDLEAHVREDPTREQSVGLLMTALYRTGRQADALRVYRRHSRQLARRGLEASPAIRFLEERILNHDPTLLPDKAVSTADIRPGYTLRGYELREEAGSGAIGVVFRAFQAAVGREVAVKVVDQTLAQSPDFVRGFAEEAHLVASLEHPHIVPLYDFWREPAGAFLVMRWMAGGSLTGRLQEPWDPDRLGRLFDQIADALGYAHSAGIVHRDITTSNILFDESGNAYLSDFLFATTGLDSTDGRKTPVTRPHYRPGDVGRGEGPTIASDVYQLGTLLGIMVDGRGSEERRMEGIMEVVAVATAHEPADRFPDMTAFRSSLRDAVGPLRLPTPKRVRRNPYRGLQPFDEGDRAMFYGRDDVVDSMLDLVVSRRLVALVGPSGSGKSSVVKAGLIPQLRDGALPGSDEWFIIYMVPGTDPFEEFHLGLRAVSIANGTSLPPAPAHELSASVDEALDGPTDQALLVIDQFEELFSAEVDTETRERFIDNLVDLVTEPAGRFRALLNLRADFSDRPLSHPRFGELIADGSMLLGPMNLQQVEEAIRRPAARVGVDVEPGLISEIVRDIVSSSAFLPLLQYVLFELFERREKDRLTVAGYRSLGGLNRVLEEQAETAYSSLTDPGRDAARQLFLRLVTIGDSGELTKRRVAVSALEGVGPGDAVAEALDAFTMARLLSHDRDPVSRAPSVELSHEAVIGGWSRLRHWVEEARTDLSVHRRVKEAASDWAESGEDPAYLLTGAALAAAIELAEGDRINLNQGETRFVTKSRQSEDTRRRLEEERKREAIDLRRRARTRARLGVSASVVAILIGILAIFAFVQRQRANELAAAEENRSRARGLATAAVNTLDSDPELSLRLAIEAAEASLEADGEILPEVVDALHRSLAVPKAEVLAVGAATAPIRGFQLLDWSGDGSSVAYVTQEGGVRILDPATGDESFRLDDLEHAAIGVQLHPGGDRFLTIHADALREWSMTRDAIGELNLPRGEEVSVAAYSRDGEAIAVGGQDGSVALWAGEQPTVWKAHDGPVTSVSFSPDGERLATAGGNSVLVWNLDTGQVLSEAPADIVRGVLQVVWAPDGDDIVVSLTQGEMFHFDAVTGTRGGSFSGGTVHQLSLAFDQTGAFLAAAGLDGFIRGYNTGTAGAPVLQLPNEGVPLKGLEVNPTVPWSPDVIAIDTEGRVLMWRDVVAGGLSELAARATGLIYPDVSSGGGRYLLVGHEYIYIFGESPGTTPVAQVIDEADGELLFTSASYQSYGSVNTQSAISHDGRLIAYAGPSGNVEVSAVDTGRIMVVPASETWSRELAFSRDDRLAGGGVDGSITVWDAHTTAQLDQLTPGELPAVAEVTRYGGSSLPPAAISDVAFSPQGVQLAWGRGDGQVGIWNTQTGEVQRLHAFAHPVASVAFSADGNRLAMADTTGIVVVVDIRSGQLVGRPDSVPGGTELTFSPDGRYLAGAGPREYVHLWDAETYDL
ncbi:MAG: BTAD domain-containing putative transcriptional regulator, partial [Acidimicrobiia bacterium]